MVTHWPFLPPPSQGMEFLRGSRDSPKQAGVKLGEKSPDGQHRHAVLLKDRDQLWRTFEIIIATHERVCAPGERGLDHDVITRGHAHRGARLGSSPAAGGGSAPA